MLFILVTSVLAPNIRAPIAASCSTFSFLYRLRLMPWYGELATQHRSFKRAYAATCCARSCVTRQIRRVKRVGARRNRREPGNRLNCAQCSCVCACWFPLAMCVGINHKRMHASSALCSLPLPCKQHRIARVARGEKGVIYATIMAVNSKADRAYKPPPEKALRTTPAARFF